MKRKLQKAIVRIAARALIDKNLKIYDFEL
jgi:hypothetical protein